ncbi:hypothetical protein U9M48_017160 [Paspalum notatum var. saurae]|uniref:Transposase n=1 Tax=Paspalum notatum var. saurae TaxID=547442 RepID=A0AAQ3T8A9_PASNO
MFILHGYHLSIADHPGLRAFFVAMKPSFEMETQNTIRKDILDHYEMEKKKVLAYLQKESERVAITIELWTDDKKRRGYIAVTGHFIDNSWELRRCLLRFLYVAYPHTSGILCEAICKCLQSWDLDRKLSTLTLHNCCSDDALIPLIESRLGQTNLLVGGRMLHMQSCAHSLDSVVKDGLEVIATAVEKIRDSVAYCLATPMRYKMFKKAAKSQRVELSEDLGLDCKSKWTSTYTMLRVALAYKTVFDHLKQIDKKFISCPAAEDWISVSSICDRLEHFHDLSEMLSGTKHVTPNTFFTHICEVKMNMHKWLRCGDPIIEKMSAAMAEKFDKYWSDIHGLMSLAIILDPRGKMALLKVCYDVLFGEGNSEQHVRKSREFLCELINEYKVQIKESKAVSSDDKVLRMTSFQAFLADMEAEDAVRPENELDCYLEEKNLPYRKDKFDILVWWKYKGRYRTLKMIARDIFAIPITRIVSESALGIGGRVLSGHFSHLSPKMLEAAMCSQDWHRNELQGKEGVKASDMYGRH